MNLINNIEIKNFKSIRHIKIDDCRRINVFIGYPNTGKSNILEALSLFSIDQSNFNFPAYIRVENLTTLFHNGEIVNQAEVRINEKHRFVARFQNDHVLFEHQFEKVTGSFERADVLKLAPNDVSQFLLDLNQDLLTKTIFKLRGKDKVLFDYNEHSIGKENNLCNIRKYEFLKQVNYSTSGYSTLSYPNGNNIFNVISSNSELRDEVSELFKVNDLRFSYDKTAQEFKILKFIGNEIFLIPYSLIADTLQRLIFYKAAILSNKETALLFEEPEAHMFPPYISKFTAEVMYDKNDNQFFINTHSPFVINDLMENMKVDELSIYVVGYKNETGETVIRKLSDKEFHEIYQYGIDLYLNLENFLMHEQ